jgi:hypothetical protein
LSEGGMGAPGVPQPTKTGQMARQTVSVAARTELLNLCA